MRKLLMFCFLFGSLSFVRAQQLTEYSQWYLHQFAINPAHAGIKQCIDVHTLYRMQWLGFDGAPRSGFLTMSIPLQNQRRRLYGARHGTGFKFETDQFGAFSVTRLNLAYAAHFNFTQDNRLSLGVYGGVVQTGYDPDKVTTHDPDPAVLQQANFLSPDASFGAWYNSANYYFGLSIRNLIPSKWEDIGTQSKYRFHASLTGGYRWKINDNFTLLPGFNLRIPPRSPASLDINLHADYRTLFGFGLGFRAGDAINATLSLKLGDQFSVNYTFDYTLSRIQSVAKNTHELSLRFTTCREDRRNANSCPLFE